MVVTQRSLSTIYFFTCPFARLIWKTIQFTFNIPPPANVTNMLGNWLNGVERKTKAQIRTDICALMWDIWNSCNDLVFNKGRNAHFYRLFEWLRIGSTSGPIYSRRRSVHIWILDATVWRWSHGISTTRVVGGFLEE
jgi:hypothetical protein